VGTRERSGQADGGPPARPRGTLDGTLDLIGPEQGGDRQMEGDTRVVVTLRSRKVAADAETLQEGEGASSRRDWCTRITEVARSNRVRSAMSSAAAMAATAVPSSAPARAATR